MVTGTGLHSSMLGTEATVEEVEVEGEEELEAESSGGHSRTTHSCTAHGSANMNRTI